VEAEEHPVRSEFQRDVLLGLARLLNECPDDLLDTIEAVLVWHMAMSGATDEWQEKWGKAPMIFGT